MFIVVLICTILWSSHEFPLSFLNTELKHRQHKQHHITQNVYSSWPTSKMKYSTIVLSRLERNMLHIVIEGSNTEQYRPSRIRFKGSKNPNTSQCYVIPTLTALFSSMARLMVISVGPPRRTVFWRLYIRVFLNFNPRKLVFWWILVHLLPYLSETFDLVLLQKWVRGLLKPSVCLKRDDSVMSLGLNPLLTGKLNGIQSSDSLAPSTPAEAFRVFYG
jgi:hypothetical protein